MVGKIHRLPRMGQNVEYHVADRNCRFGAIPEVADARGRWRRRASLIVVCIAVGGLAALLSVEDTRHEMNFQVRRLIAAWPS